MKNTILILILLLSTHCFAQTTLPESVKTVVDFVTVKVDTNYIDDLHRYLTLRVFSSRDYIDYKLYDGHYGDKVSYKPNTPFTVGVGASYKFLGINIGISAPFINRHSIYGETKFFNISSHFYLPRFIVDVYGNSYRGYHLMNSSDITYSGTPYLRPDLRTSLVGINFLYILNSKRFSYMGTFSQLAYQKKSAGSFIFGGSLYSEFVRADSPVIPGNLQYPAFFRNNTFNRSSIYSLTVNGGYAYTWVVKKHYFLAGSLSFGAGLNYSTLTDKSLDEKDDRFRPQLNTDYRIATGYNSDEYYIAAQYVHILNKSYAPLPATRQDFGDGTYRIIIAKRFKLKRHNIIDKTIDNSIKNITQ